MAKGLGLGVLNPKPKGFRLCCGFCRLGHRRAQRFRSRFRVYGLGVFQVPQKSIRKHTSGPHFYDPKPYNP